MTKILIHSNAPWTPSGYGKQAALAGRILTGLGHKVSYSAFQGLGGQPITWQVPGTTGRGGQCAVYPMGVLPFSPDTIVPNAMLAEADVIVSIMDTYMLMPAAGQLRACGIPFAPLVVTDCQAMNGGPGLDDQDFIVASGALPAAVSRFGLDRLGELSWLREDRGWDPPYVPHAVDTAVYKPPADRAQLRADNGTADHFIIGIAGANNDIMRKGYQEQFAAFARFSQRHKDARLALFTVVDSPRGLNLGQMLSDFGILELTSVMPSFEQNSGLLQEEFMAAWYGSLDLLSMCSYAEGFGVPLLEAQACGTPVVATDGSAMTELARPAGWLADGFRYWNAVHRGWWTRPDESSIVHAWERAYQERGPAWDTRSSRAFNFAQGYSLDAAAGHWTAFLRDIEDWKDTRTNGTDD